MDVSRARTARRALIARGLMAPASSRGDRVAVWATNVPEWIVLQFALAKIGAILVTVNTSLRAREIEYLLRQSETSTLFTIAGFKGVDYMAELRAIGAIGRLHALQAACSSSATRARRTSTPYDAAARRSPQRVSERELDEREVDGRRRRRDQHAIHVGHDRLSQGRDALEPQHRQQRLLARRRARLHAGRSAVPVRAAVSLLRLRDRRARRLHARRLPVPGRVLRCRCACSRPSSANAARRSTACRRCSSPSSSIRSSTRFDTDVAAHRHHGRRAVPGAADAARDRPDAPAAS